MGLGGFLAAKSDAEHYESERLREHVEIRDLPEVETAEVASIFQSYGLTEQESAAVTEKLTQRPEAWVDFMMRFELGLDKPDPRRALTSGLTIAGAYVVGGLIPLAPYMFLATARTGLWFSVLVTLLALATFGYVKGHFTGVKPLRSGLQTTLIGGLAATAAFLIARAIS
jgi:VIT1/CCC1 family predicted Fe2+/Mn2+ transporter